jgi:hypothetical protein
MHGLVFRMHIYGGYPCLACVLISEDFRGRDTLVVVVLSPAMRLREL